MWWQYRLLGQPTGLARYNGGTLISPRRITDLNTRYLPVNL